MHDPAATYVYAVMRVSETGGHDVRGEGKLYIRIFPTKPMTARPLETRMGTGKGEPDHWVAVVKEGTMLFELGGVTEQQAKMCFARLAHKMPMRVRMVKRRPA